MARKRKTCPQNIFGLRTLTDRYTAAASIQALADSLIERRVCNGKGIVVSKNDIETYRLLMKLSDSVQWDKTPPYITSDTLLALPGNIKIKDLRIVSELVRKIEERLDAPSSTKPEAHGLSL